MRWTIGSDTVEIEHDTMIPNALWNVELLPAGQRTI